MAHYTPCNRQWLHYAPTIRNPSVLRHSHRRQYLTSSVVLSFQLLLQVSKIGLIETNANMVTIFLMDICMSTMKAEEPLLLHVVNLLNVRVAHEPYVFLNQGQHLHLRPLQL